jgi:ABC-type sugar transport system ATPase subunit
MDEPLSNLDAKLRAATRIELVDLQRRLEATVVYVTHDQVEAMTMGHRVAVLDRGVLRQIGSPQDVYDRPANLFVARFIGTPPMNTISGDAAASLASRTVPELVVGVRPEHLELGVGEGPGLAATVELVEHLGHELHVVCRLADGQLVTVRQGSHTAAPSVASAVRVVAQPERLHCFDGVTGERAD